MNYRDLKNNVLQRVRSRGVNFGASPQNQPGDFEPPYYLNQRINQGYGETLRRTLDIPQAPLFVTLLSTLNATGYSLNPIAANGPTINPSALYVYEATYTPAGTPERPLPIVDTNTFRMITGNYVRRFGNFGPIPYVACQLFGERRLEVFPGTAVAGDTITLKICPDPESSPAGCLASNGGLLQGDTDVPLFTPTLHRAIEEWAVYLLLDVKNRGEQRKEALEAFNTIIDEALAYAATTGEGYAEQRVVDQYRFATYDSP